jgi:hypothetical protein
VGEQAYEDIEKLNCIYWKVHVAVVELKHVLRNLGGLGVLTLFHTVLDKGSRIQIKGDD